ncbi:MAG: hypothetical protein QM783_19790 [Phycisphaerales bacterium]
MVRSALGGALLNESTEGDGLAGPFAVGDGGRTVKVSPAGTSLMTPE